MGVMVTHQRFVSSPLCGSPLISGFMLLLEYADRIHLGNLLFLNVCDCMLQLGRIVYHLHEHL